MQKCKIRNLKYDCKDFAIKIDEPESIDFTLSDAIGILVLYRSDSVAFGPIFAKIKS